MINDTSRPLVLVGSNVMVWYIYEVLTEKIGYQVKGIVDDDYHGQGHYQDIPIIAKEQDLAGAEWKEYQYLCITNWQPVELIEPCHGRNKQKRQRLINLLEDNNLDVATVVHPGAVVTKYKTTLGRGVYIDVGAFIGPNIQINDFTTIWAYGGIAHDCVIGRNCVMQRYTSLFGNNVMEDNVYMGQGSRVPRDYIVLKSGTFIHPEMKVMRSTAENEVISLVGQDLRKVYHKPTAE